ncbi:DUF421 domain-containing protein [soil metagenome]
MELEVFGGGYDILEVAIRGAIMYVFAVGLLRVAGKRTTMTTASFDFIVTVALGSVLASTVVSTTRPIAQGMVGIAALVALQWLVSLGVSRSATLERIVVSPAKLLLQDGKIIRSSLLEERLSVEQLEQTLRQSGYGSKEPIEAAILESSGSMSVIGDSNGPNELVAKKEIGSRAI